MESGKYLLKTLFSKYIVNNRKWYIFRSTSIQSLQSTPIFFPDINTILSMVRFVHWSTQYIGNIVQNFMKQYFWWELTKNSNMSHQIWASGPQYSHVCLLMFSMSKDVSEKHQHPASVILCYIFEFSFVWYLRKMLQEHNIVCSRQPFQREEEGLSKWWDEGSFMMSKHIWL